MLKWTGALAGAAVVGAAVGVGADMLIRPTRSPPPTISYKPPLSPDAKARASAIVQGLVNAHGGEKEVYFSYGNTSASGVLTRVADVCKVVVRDGKVVGVVPEDIVNPTKAREDAYLSEEDVWSGRIRGIPWGFHWAQRWQIDSPSRLLYPMKRVNARGDPNGKFVRIGWDEAIATVVSKLVEIKAKYGPNSVVIASNCDGGSEPYLNLFGVAATTGWGCTSVGNNYFAGQEVLGAFWGLGEAPNSLEKTKLLVMWGWDPTQGSFAGYSTYFISLAREKGMKVVSIDVKDTMAAEAFADQWIPVRPQTDMAFMLAVANVLLKESLYDAAYVGKFVEPTGFAKWKDYVLGNTAGPDGKIDRTPEWAEVITGVPAETIRGFARLYAASKPTYLFFGNGAGRQSRGMNPARGAVYLQAMTGNVGIEGGSSGLAGIAFNDVDSTPFWPSVPGLFPLPAPPNTLDLYSEFKLADAILLRDDYNGGKITKEQYFTTIGNNLGNPAPNVRMLLVFGDNTPGSGHVNFPKMAKAYAKLDLFVNAKRHLDGAAKYADIILPLTQIYEEAPNWQLNSRGFVYLPKIIDPPGEARDGDWIRTQIAKGLGVNDKYYPAFQDVSWEDWGSEWEKVRKGEYEAWAAKDATKQLLPNPPSWNDFLNQPVLRIDIPYPASVTWSDQISGGKPFFTKSGKMEFYDPDLETFDVSKLRYMFYTGVGAKISPMAMWENPEEGPLDPKVSKYPLWLGSGGHNRHSIFGMNWMNPMLFGEVSRHTVWVNPADANSRGIKDGDLVRVYNDRAEMVIQAYVTSRLAPGSVWLYPSGNADLNGAGIDRGGSANMLTDDNLTAAPAGQEPTNALVEVEKF